MSLHASTQQEDLDYISATLREVLQHRDYDVHETDMVSELGQPPIRVQTKELIQRAVPLTRDCPVEYIHKGKLQFGNVMECAEEGRSVTLRSAIGDVLKLDKAQLVTVWAELSDENPPVTTEDWAEVTRDALQLLRRLPQRKTDMVDFWQALQHLHRVSKKDSSLAVDSQDLSIFVFQEHKFLSWLDPSSFVTDSVRVSSAAQRMAMAWLLYHDDVHFKRRPSAHAWPEDAAADELRDAEHLSVPIESQPAAYVVEGGYRVLDESMVRFRENEIFQQFLDRYHSKGNASIVGSPHHQNIVQRYTRDLELFAVASLSQPLLPPPKHLAAVLKHHTVSISPAGGAPPASPTCAAAMSILRTLGRDAPQLYRPIDIPAGADTESRPASSARVLNLTPWPSDLLAVSQELSDRLRARRTVELPKTPLPRASGKRNSLGVFDFRGAAFPPLCLDAAGTDFADDAFQWHEESGELLIHVTDVPLFQPQRDCDLLRRCAQERLLSCYLPSGPVHMLPPTALHALSLTAAEVDAEAVNEVLTVAVRIDESGAITSTRVFPAWIGPVTKLSFTQAAALLVSRQDEVVGFSTRVVQSLRTVQRWVHRLLRRDSFWNSNFAAATEDDGLEAGLDDVYPVLNTALSLYANVTYATAAQLARLPVPVAWEHWDRHGDGSKHGPRVRRFASQPLRSYVSLLQQRQVKAALRLDLSTSRRDCIAAVMQHNEKRRQLSRLLTGQAVPRSSRRHTPGDAKTEQQATPLSAERNVGNLYLQSRDTLRRRQPDDEQPSVQYTAAPTQGADRRKSMQ